LEAVLVGGELAEELEGESCGYTDVWVAERSDQIGSGIFEGPLIVAGDGALGEVSGARDVLRMDNEEFVAMFDDGQHDFVAWFESDGDEALRIGGDVRLLTDGVDAVGVD